jgi:hypothetical protein
MRRSDPAGENAIRPGDAGTGEGAGSTAARAVASKPGARISGPGIWALFEPRSATISVQFSPPPGVTPLDLLISQLINAAILALVAMFLGNSSRRLAQLLLAVAVGLIAAITYRWLHSDATAWSPRSVASVAGAVGLLVVALPPPQGPIRNAQADVFDPSRLPPRNVGNSLVKRLGFVLLSSAYVSWILFVGLAPPAPPANPGGQVARNVAPAQKAVADAPAPPNGRGAG